MNGRRNIQVKVLFLFVVFVLIKGMANGKSETVRDGDPYGVSEFLNLDRKVISSL